MQIEASTAIIIVSVTIVLSLGAVVTFLVVAALGYFGVLQQLLAASWLLGTLIVVATFFSGSQRDYSQTTPNVRCVAGPNPENFAREWRNGSGRCGKVVFVRPNV